MPYQSTQIVRRHLDPVQGEGREEIIRTQERVSRLYGYAQRNNPVIGFFSGRTKVIVFHKQVVEHFTRVLVDSDLGWIDTREFTFEEVEQPKDETIEEVVEALTALQTEPVEEETQEAPVQPKPNRKR